MTRGLAFAALACSIACAPAPTPPDVRDSLRAACAAPENRAYLLARPVDKPRVLDQLLLGQSMHPDVVAMLDRARASQTSSERSAHLQRALDRARMERDRCALFGHWKNLSGPVPEIELPRVLAADLPIAEHDALLAVTADGLSMTGLPTVQLPRSPAAFALPALASFIERERARGVHSLGVAADQRTPYGALLHAVASAVAGTRTWTPSARVDLLLRDSRNRTAGLAIDFAEDPTAAPWDLSVAIHREVIAIRSTIGDRDIPRNQRGGFEIELLQRIMAAVAERLWPHPGTRPPSAQRYLLRAHQDTALADLMTVVNVMRPHFAQPVLGPPVVARPAAPADADVPAGTPADAPAVAPATASARTR